MKKTAIMLLALTLLLSACNAGEEIDLTTLPIQGGGEFMWAYSVGSVDDLKEHADVIVRGIIGKPENIR